MATLTAPQLAELRRGIAPDVAAVNFNKPQVNAALQAVEDWFETTARTEIGAAIETAAPGVFTNAQKRVIAKYWLRQKFDRGG